MLGDAARARFDPCTRGPYSRIGMARRSPYMQARVVLSYPYIHLSCPYMQVRVVLSDPRRGRELLCPCRGLWLVHTAADGHEHHVHHAHTPLDEVLGHSDTRARAVENFPHTPASGMNVIVGCLHIWVSGTNAMGGANAVVKPPSTRSPGPYVAGNWSGLWLVVMTVMVMTVRVILAMVMTVMVMTVMVTFEVIVAVTLGRTLIVMVTLTEMTTPHSTVALAQVSYHVTPLRSATSAWRPLPLEPIASRESTRGCVWSWTRSRFYPLTRTLHGIG